MPSIPGLSRAQAARLFPTKTAVRDQRPWGNVGQRIFGGRMGLYNNSTPTTFQVTCEVAGPFDAIQIIFANTKPGYSDNAVMIKASVAPTAADLNNSGGAWTTVYKQGMLRMGLPLAPATNRISYALTDVTPLSSLARTDGGNKPILVLRAFMAASGDLPVVGNGTDDFTNWASRSNGRRWAMRQMAGDGVNDPTAFTSTTNVSQSPIIGVRFWYRGRIVNVMVVGDSISDARGTFLGDGIAERLALRLGTSSLAIEASNCGFSGQSTPQYGERALDILDSEIRPDILIFPVASPNNESPPLTEAGFAASDAMLHRVLAACARVGTVPVLWTMLPTGPTVKAWGASDALRVAANNRALALRDRGVLVADTATPLSGPVVDGQVGVSTTDFPDYIHPGDAGIEKMVDALEPLFRRAGGF